MHSGVTITVLSMLAHYGINIGLFYVTCFHIFKQIFKYLCKEFNKYFIRISLDFYLQ